MWDHVGSSLGSSLESSLESCEIISRIICGHPGSPGISGSWVLWDHLLDHLSCGVISGIIWDHLRSSLGSSWIIWDHWGSSGIICGTICHLGSSGIIWDQLCDHLTSSGASESSRWDHLGSYELALVAPSRPLARTLASYAGGGGAWG